VPVGGLDKSVTNTKLRGQRAFATPRSMGRLRGLKAYSVALSPQTGVGGVGYTQLPDGQYALDTDLQSLKRQWPEGYDILTKQGFDAYNKAITEAQEQGKVTSALKAKYQEALKYKKPLTGRWQPPEKPSFKHITLVVTGDIPGTPGFYSVTDTSIKADKEKNETHETTTSVFARLEDGSLSLVDKKSTTKTYPPEWVSTPGVMGSSEAYEGRDPNKPPPGYEKGFKKVKTGWGEATEVVGGWYPHSQAVKLKSLSPYGTVTHEQRRGASLLAPILAKKEGKDYTELSRKEKQEFYQTALGLVSASGYFDPESIVKLPGESGYGIFDPKTGKRVWGVYTPEVTNALKKLKPYLKADNTYDWAKIITKGSTQEVIAASKASGIELSALGGIRQAIDAFPELKTALQTGGWEGYEAKAKELMADKELWEQKLKEDFPDLYDKYKNKSEKEFLDAAGDLNKQWDIYNEYINKGWVVVTEDGGIAPDLFQILINNKKSTGVYANDINQEKLLTIGFSLEDIEKAEKYLESLPTVYSDYIGQYGSDTFQEAAKTGNLPYSSSGWNVPKTKEAIQDLQTFLQNTSAKITKNVRGTLGDTFGANLTIMLSGAGLNLATMPGIMAFQGKLGLQDQSAIPGMAVEMAKGIGESFVTVLSPMKATKAFTTVPFEFGGQVLTVALVAEPFLGPALRGGGFVRTVAKGDYVPLRSMSMEAATARVSFTEAQLAKMRKAGVTEADIIRAGTELNEQLVRGAKVAKIKLGGVEVRIKNIEYSRENPLSLFNSTPDISLVEQGGVVPVYKELYTAAKAAVEPMERSYLEGQRAVKPGIIEVRISDPGLIEKIMPQKRLIEGGKTLEPEAMLPSLDQLQGWGYYLQPIPGKLGKGTTFDAYLGELAIRRFTLAKVIDNPAGLVQVRLGKGGNGGVVAIGDLHGTPNLRGIFEDVNSGFVDKVLSGDPKDPATWHWEGSADKGRTVVIMGDSIDRGPMYSLLRDTFNRLYDEARASGDSFERLLGNHELAYLAKDAIKGIKYTDKARISIRAGILEDLKAGRVKAAVDADGKLFTHAGVSTGVFKEYKGKSAGYISKDLNAQVLQAVKRNNYKGKIFAKGRVEKGNSLLKNERPQGGIFWLRPQEATIAQRNLGFQQVVGHNPGFGIRRIWGDNFIETDIGRRQGKTGAYVDTPNIRTIEGDIIKESLGGKAPNLSADVLTVLKLKAIRDTIADFFIGWDGRIQAIQKLKNNHKAVRAMVKSINQQIKERKAAGDSIGVKYLKRQKSELLSSTGSDYLYGGIALWRDIVMGRQNSVKILGNARNMTKAQLVTGLRIANLTRARLSRMSDYDLRQLFGYSKTEIERMLDTKGINIKDYESAREAVAERLANLRDIVDNGLDRSVAQYLDRDAIIRRYRRALEERVTRLYRLEKPYEYEYAPRARGAREVVARRPIVEVTSARVPYERVTTARVPSIRRPVGRAPAPRAPTVRTPGPPYPPPPPPPPPTKLPPPPPPIIMRAEGGIKGGRKGYKGAVAWAQGQLKRGNKLVTTYRVWKRPFRQEDLEAFDENELPPGVKIVPGVSSAYKTVQQFRGQVTPSETQEADIGAFVATVHQPEAKPGKAGAIKFERDIPTSKIRGQKSDAWKKLPMHTTLAQLIQIVFRSTEAQVDRLGVDTLEAMGMEAQEAKVAKPSAKVRFAKSRLAEKLEKASRAEIVSAINSTGLSASETKELLKMLPDRERQQLILALSEPGLYAPTRGMPKAEYLPTKLRRKKSKTKKTAKPEMMLVGARL